MKKKAISDSIFIYVISALIIILIVYFGYRGITSMQKANDQSIIEKMQVQLKSDLSALSFHYGSKASLGYELTKKYNMMCFVDLTIDPAEKIIRDAYIEVHLSPLILDSVTGDNTNNVFLVGEDFLGFESGPVEIDEPYIYCVNKSGVYVKFNATGGGDRTYIPDFFNINN